MDLNKLSYRKSNIILANALTILSPCCHTLSKTLNLRTISSWNQPNHCDFISNHISASLDTICYVPLTRLALSNKYNWDYESYQNLSYHDYQDRNLLSKLPKTGSQFKTRVTLSFNCFVFLLQSTIIMFRMLMLLFFRTHKTDIVLIF